MLMVTPKWNRHFEIKWRIETNTLIVWIYNPCPQTPNPTPPQVGFCFYYFGSGIDGELGHILLIELLNLYLWKQLKNKNITFKKYFNLIVKLLQ